MSRILVVGEDALCCALGERLVAACLPGWKLVQTSIDTKGVTKLLPDLKRFLGFAQYLHPVLCIADTDGQCAVELRAKWLPQAHERFVFRLAITEAESWVLADRQGFSQAMKVPLNKLPQCPDEESDPKRLILTLVKRSKLRQLSNEVVSSADPNKPGTGYNLHLGAFVRGHWDAKRAAQHSPSLARAVKHLEQMGAEHV